MGLKIKEGAAANGQMNTYMYHGIIFGSVEGMADAYGVSVINLLRDIRLGSTLDAAMDEQLHTFVRGPEGHVYSSLEELCTKHEISVEEYEKGISRGMTMCKALSQESRFGKIEATDHTGMRYPNIFRMCQAYMVTLEEFNRRIHGGIGLKEALLCDSDTEYEEKQWLLRILIENPTIGQLFKAARCNTEHDVKSMLKRCTECIVDDLISSWGSRSPKDKCEGLQFTGYDIHVTDSYRKVYGDAALKRDTLTMCRQGKIAWMLEKQVNSVTNWLGVVKSEDEYLEAEFGFTDSKDKADKKDTVPIESSNEKEDNSISKFLSAYWIDESTYEELIKSGFSTENAERYIEIIAQCRTGHDGKVYKSVSDMLVAYGLSRHEYRKRLTYTNSRNAALTYEGSLPDTETEAIEDADTEIADTKHDNTNKARKPGITASDHIGTQYKSVSEMCRAYNVNVVTYINRRKRGLSIADALTGKKKKEPAIDHLGNRYKNISRMCLAYGISIDTYSKRVKAGLSVREALTKPTDKTEGK